MQEIGTVISTPEGPSTDQFSFVIAETKGIPIRKGQFVQLATEDGLLIARVAEIVKTNRYFMQAEAVREFTREGRAMEEFFPTDRWECLMATAVPLGIWDNGTQRRVSFPPSPGTKVYCVDKEILFNFLGLDAKGLAVGEVEFHGIEAKLNLTKLFQKHCSILAQTGFGKSYLVAVIIEEILKRSDEAGKPALIVIDPHGEYVGFSNDPKFSASTRVFSAMDIKIGVGNLSSYQIAELQPHLTSVGRRELAKVISELKSRKRAAYGMNELLAAIEASNINPKTKEPLLTWLSDLAATGLFDGSDRPSVNELAKAGQLSVLDFSDFAHLRDRQVALTYLARKLFNYRREGLIPPFILFVEEAHNFAPEQVEKSAAISKSIIETIAREGRKFNACLVLVSQRPIQLSTTALSQCDTHIVMHISNPYDLEHIGKSCEGITADMLKLIPGLKVGEAIITGEAVNYPLLIKVRERESKPSEKGALLEDAIVEFNKGLARKVEDLDAFR